MMIVQLFTRERESRREFDALNRRSRDVQMIANVYEAAQFSSVESLSSITVAVILWFGGGSVIRHLVTLGTLVAFIQYAQQFFMPLRDISTKYSALQSALAAIEKIHALMEGEQRSHCLHSRSSRRFRAGQSCSITSTSSIVPASRF